MSNKAINLLKAELADANDALNLAVRTLAPKHAGGEMEAYEAAHKRLLTAERKLAAAEGRPYADLCDCPISWDVGAPLPTLLQSDQTARLFFLLADEDGRVGCISFERLSSTLFGAPNDETFEGHPLYGSGFEPYRAMRVINSPWIVQLEKMNSIHQYHDPARFAATQHFIFPFHDTTFECVAHSFTALTVERRLSDAIKDAVCGLF